MTAPKLILAGALVAIFLLSLDTVESQCLDCETPYGPYCCKTSFNGVCCECLGNCGKRQLKKQEKEMEILPTMQNKV